MSQCPHVCAPLPLLPHDWTAAHCSPPELVPVPAPAPSNHILRHPVRPNYGARIVSCVELSNISPVVTLLRILSLVLIWQEITLVWPFLLFADYCSHLFPFSPRRQT